MNKAISIRGKEYGTEVERLIAEHPVALCGMAADLIVAGLMEAPDYEIDFKLTLRVNDHFNELTGDRGAFIGSVKEAMAKVAKEI